MEIYEVIHLAVNLSKFPDKLKELIARCHLSFYLRQLNIPFLTFGTEKLGGKPWLVFSSKVPVLSPDLSGSDAAYLQESLFKKESDAWLEKIANRDVKEGDKRISADELREGIVFIVRGSADVAQIMGEGDPDLALGILSGAAGFYVSVLRPLNPELLPVPADCKVLFLSNPRGAWIAVAVSKQPTPNIPSKSVKEIDPEKFVKRNGGKGNE